jgi:hypothetical protein
MDGRFSSSAWQQRFFLPLSSHSKYIGWSASSRQARFSIGDLALNFASGHGDSVGGGGSF